jgi:hypothetical protein
MLTGCFTYDNLYAKSKVTGAGAGFVTDPQFVSSNICKEEAWD